MKLNDVKKDQTYFVRLEHGIYEVKFVRLFCDSKSPRIHYVINIATMGEESDEDACRRFYPTVEDAVNRQNSIDDVFVSDLDEVINYPKESMTKMGAHLYLHAYEWTGVEPQARELTWEYDLLNENFSSIDILDEEYSTAKECAEANTTNVFRFEEEKPKTKKYSVRIYLHTFVDFDVEAETKEDAIEIVENLEYDMDQILDNMTPGDDPDAEEID